MLRFDPIAEARTRWSDRWKGADRMAAATSVIRVQQIISSAVERALAPLELTFARYEVLVLLTFSREGQLPMAKMGVRLQVHPTSVTNAVDRLEAQGLVRRLPHPTDRRITPVSITDEGRAVVEKATDALTSANFGLGMIDGEMVAHLIAILREVRLGAGDFESTNE